MLIMNRRKFLASSALASSSMWVPQFIQNSLNRQFMSSRSQKILVVIQWTGGNDGLNTLVPYQNDIYYQKRPNLAIAADKTLVLNDELGLHPSLKPIQDLYNQGYVSIINNVGYPNPDRSHFRSMDIWHSGSSSQEYWQSGWLGRYLDQTEVAKSSPYHALEVGEALSLALKGDHNKGFIMKNPDQLKRTSQNKILQAIADQYVATGKDDHADYLYKTLIDTQSSADYLAQQAKSYRSNVSYPGTEIGRNLKMIAQLITTDTDTGIYYTDLGSFDTHANQLNQHSRLLQQYADAVSAFMQDLKAHDLLEDTLILTFSEFGRRVGENASRGTDHGTANSIWLMGGNLQKSGIFNGGPDLQNLQNGDLKFEIDFRQIYSEILAKWINADPIQILKQDYSRLGII